MSNEMSKDEINFYSGIDCMYSNYFIVDEKRINRIMKIEKIIKKLQAEKNKIIKELQTKV